MHRPRPGSSSSRGVTRIELVAALAFLGLGGFGVTLLTGTASAGTEARSAVGDAKRVLGAAEAWTRDFPKLGCPSVSQLIEDGALSRDARVDDPWGGKFRIACDGSLRVRSPGEDRKQGTPDDVLVEAAGARLARNPRPLG